MHQDLKQIEDVRPCPPRHDVPAHAVVLCAGFGTRLAPITDHVPKPLLPLANRPMLDRVLDRLARAGVSQVGINLHHHAGKIAQHLAARHASPAVHLVREETILDTGGGIAGFRSWLEAAASPAVLVHNADVVTDIDLAALAAEHQASRAEVTLALVDHAPTNVVALLPDGRVASIRGEVPLGATCCTYSGVAMLSARFVGRLQPGQRASVIDAMRAAIADQPGSVRGWCVPTGTYWRDMGTVDQYLAVHREALAGHGVELPASSHLRDSRLLDASAEVHPGASLSGFVVLGADCLVEDGVALEDCVVLPGTHLKRGFAARRAIISRECVARIG